MGDVVAKIEKGILWTTWFGRGERMDEGRLTKQMYKASVSAQVGKGRSRQTYHDQIVFLLTINSRKGVKFNKIET